VIEEWRKQLQELSGNLTTNEKMPEELIKKLLDEDESLKNKLQFEEVVFPELEETLGAVKGLNILSGLQNLHKKGCLTVFRAVRFPTFKRMYEMVSHSGYAASNYEQARIADLYHNEKYIQKRAEIMSDYRFWVQPQERVVHGLPLFCLANDALQIHRAFRGDIDQVAIIAIYIPHELLESGKLKLIANTAIDLEYSNSDRDFEIKDFVKDNGSLSIDFSALRTRGIDLHEMYTADLPENIVDAKKAGIEQEFLLVDIYKIAEPDIENINTVFRDTELLKKNRHFLHGFFGDQNIFGRRKAKYLPYKCSKIFLK
jgi:hypothetical protein